MGGAGGGVVGVAGFGISIVVGGDRCIVAAVVLVMGVIAG